MFNLGCDVPLEVSLSVLVLPCVEPAGVDGCSPAGPSEASKRFRSSVRFLSLAEEKTEVSPSVDSVAPRTHTTPIPSL